MFRNISRVVPFADKVPFASGHTFPKALASLDSVSVFHLPLLPSCPKPAAVAAVETSAQTFLLLQFSVVLMSTYGQGLLSFGCGN